MWLLGLLGTIIGAFVTYWGLMELNLIIFIIGAVIVFFSFVCFMIFKGGEFFIDHFIIGFIFSMLLDALAIFCAFQANLFVGYGIIACMIVAFTCQTFIPPFMLNMETAVYREDTYKVDYELGTKTKISSEYKGGTPVGTYIHLFLWVTPMVVACCSSKTSFLKYLALVPTGIGILEGIIVIFYNFKHERPSNTKEGNNEGNYVVGFILGFLFVYIGVIICLIIHKRKTTKGALFGFITFLIAGLIYLISSGAI